MIPEVTRLLAAAATEWAYSAREVERISAAIVASDVTYFAARKHFGEFARHE